MIMGAVRLACAVAAVLSVAALTACSGPAGTAGPGAKAVIGVQAETAARAPIASYYLALGDSLAQGVQPDAGGISVATRQGYPDQVYPALLGEHPGLRLVKLGCPGETTKTMIHGGICRYPAGSQLAAAAGFLRAHRGHMVLVTIDIGANDTEICGAQHGLAKMAACFGTGVPRAIANLATIMTRLREASGPGVRIAGMSYYLPALAQWRDGRLGQAVAWLTERLAVGYNTLLQRVYVRSGARVADVFGAFDTSNFAQRVAKPGIGTVPRNVALLCQWTWACAAPPRGPNQHANQAGYAVIARAFLQAIG
jgi:lysophospholipase L1-like esterase